MLHTKALHYPSGFPMPRSPPLFICSSPGPDPYRSNDNVYEELEHRSRFLDCDRQLHSDEEFAEDELSIPGDRSLNKSSSENTTVATIYQERGAGSSSSNPNENSYLERNRVERNSLLSSASSSANDNNNATRPNMRNSSSSNDSNHHNHHNTLNHLTNNNSTISSNGAGGTAGIFRFRTSRPSACKAKSTRQKTNNFSMDNLNSSTETTPADEVPPMESGNNDAVSTSTSSNNNNNNGNGDAISASGVLNGNHIEGDTNNNSNICGRNNYYGTESEVERRNRINAQLSNPTLNVATIFRDRNIRYHPTRANANYYAPPHHMMANRTNNNGENNNRSRTNPRTDRRRNVLNATASVVNANRENNNNTTNSNSINTINNNQEYLYHEPVYHENMVYDPYNGTSNGGRNQIYHQPYILPEFTTFRNFNNLNNPHQPLYNSAMGSDSGYSQNTQTSGRSLWGRRKRAGNNNINNNGNTITTPSALARNETSDTYEGS